MPESNLTVTLRTSTGKNEARRMRAAGNLPANVYGGGGPATSITLISDEFDKAMVGGQNTLLHLKGDKAVDDRTVMIREVQRHPLKNNILHVDLIEVDKDTKIDCQIQIVVDGKSKGVSAGGILYTHAHSIQISCLPGDIPNQFLVDITEMMIGDMVRAGDLDLPKNSELIDDPESPVVEIKSREEMMPEEVEEEEAAEGEEGAEGEGSEGEGSESSEGK